MKIIEVNSRNTKQAFYNFPRKLYHGDNNFTCPLDANIELIFNPRKNDQFIGGDACRWILNNEYGQTIGRIAAFYNIKKAFGSNLQPTGGIGFFECINDQQAANQLFNIAKAWLVSKGMQAMDGPVNFGEDFKYWGLLVEGFSHQAYGMLYNFPYYKTLFENYGFRTYFEQFSYHLDPTKPLPEKMLQFAEFIGRKTNYTFEHFNYQYAEKYLRDTTNIYNEAGTDLLIDFVPLDYKDFEKMFFDIKGLLIEDLTVFAYDNGKPIGMIITFPDINRVIKNLNGKLNLMNRLKLWHNKKTKIDRARLIVSGIIPGYRQTGIMGPLFFKVVDDCKRHGISELEISWVGDYNKTENSFYQQLGTATKAKTHITYRYLFEREKPFTRFSNTPRT